MQSDNNKAFSLNPSQAKGTIVDEPTVNDVLFGRGASIINFQGNKRFRKLVETRKKEYAATSRHQIKHEISCEILKEITKRKGRFLRPADITTIKNLKLPKEKKFWFIATKADALEKIKQTLRDPNTYKKDNQTETENDESNKISNEQTNVTARGLGDLSPDLIGAGNQGMPEARQDLLRRNQLNENLQALASLRENNLVQRRLLLQEEIARNEAIHRATQNIIRQGLVAENPAMRGLVAENPAISSLNYLPQFRNSLSTSIPSIPTTFAHRLPTVPVANPLRSELRFTPLDSSTLLQDRISLIRNNPTSSGQGLEPRLFNRASQLASLLGQRTSTFGQGQVDQAQLSPSHPSATNSSEKKRSLPNQDETVSNGSETNDDSLKMPATKKPRIN